MPELPEVEYGRRLAESVVRGARIVSVRCAEDRIVFETPPRRVRQALRGALVRAVHRRGKHLWFELDRETHPLFHFGMTGAFRTRRDVPLVLSSSSARTKGICFQIRFVNVDIFHFKLWHYNNRCSRSMYPAL